MGLIKTALRKPITILVLVAGLFFFGINAVRTIKIDIFPNLNLPVIYISHPYGGFTPDQMEGYFAKPYINLLLYVSGVKTIETQNIQGLTLIKLTFYPATNMAQAAAEVTAYANRAQASFPPGSNPPFIIRFDASTLPVGQLILSSSKRNNNELLDLANVYVRSSFTQIPGLVAPAPFGGNVRAVVIKVDPELMRSHHLTAEQVVAAVSDNNQVSPAGNVRIGDLNYFTPSNTTIGTIKDFGNIPLFGGGVQTLFLKDIAKVEDGADITTDYVLVNGKRSVYLPITKSADASTWEVVQNLKKAIPRFQAILPDDVKLTYAFDQSVYVINSVKSLISEGAIGAVLTGIMVLLFLGDVRGALIVIMTIPTSIISGIFFLSLFGQTLNIMTLSGLALAIGILVDESTVTIENIHQHLDMGKPKALAIWDACREIAFPKLLILFCILAVFAPAFTMSGIPGALFLPLAMAIGFSMITSFLLSQTFVPVMANWLMRDHKNHDQEKTGLPATGNPELVTATNSHVNTTYTVAGTTVAANGKTHTSDSAETKEHTGHEAAWEQKEQLIKGLLYPDPTKKQGGFDRFRSAFLRFLASMMPYRRIIGVSYVVIFLGITALLLNVIGRDILPKVNSGEFQLRLRAPDGTRFERTEQKLLRVEAILDTLVGRQNIEVTSAMAGIHPPQFSTSPLYLFMAGPQEAVLQVNLKEDYHVNLDDLEERLRNKIHSVMPELKLSFEPIELTSKILSQGSPTPIEVKISGKDKKRNVVYANKLIAEMSKIPYLRDIQIGQSYNYPAININIDRIQAARLGVSISDISHSLSTSTSSSRYTDKVFWLDKKSNLSYNVQVEIPEFKMSGINTIKEIPVRNNQDRPVLSDVASVNFGTTNGENDNIGAIPVLSVTANLHNKDLGMASTDVRHAIVSLGKLPRGLTMEAKGQSLTLDDTLASLQNGLLVAIIVIFLMLAANFQSFRVSIVVLATVPAVLAGSLLLLIITGSTLNLQSYMGIIMSVGVSISNSVLLITNAEQLRSHNGNARLSAMESTALRLRPVLMTSLAMIVGMIPMALGLGEGGDQTSALGRAVIGGLFASTFAALLILPLVFSWVQEKAGTDSVSLDPEDEESKFYVPTN